MDFVIGGAFCWIQKAKCSNWKRPGGVSSGGENIDFAVDKSAGRHGNPHTFLRKRLDLPDKGGLELMSWPYRNYSTYLGRWLQAEKLGMIPNDGPRNPPDVREQYKDGMNLYEYVRNNPVTFLDPHGLKKFNWCERLCCTWKEESHTPSFYWCMPLAFPVVCNSCTDFACFSVGRSKYGCYFKGKRCKTKIRDGKQNFHGWGTFCVSGCVGMKFFKPEHFPPPSPWSPGGGGKRVGACHDEKPFQK